jgi:hypothetical protein
MSNEEGCSCLRLRVVLMIVAVLVESSLDF